MIDFIKLPFDVLFQFSPLIELIILPLGCFGILLGAISIVKEIIKIV